MEEKVYFSRRVGYGYGIEIPDITIGLDTNGASLSAFSRKCALKKSSKILKGLSLWFLNLFFNFAILSHFSSKKN
jgi:hypothetical protein